MKEIIVWIFFWIFVGTSLFQTVATGEEWKNNNILSLQQAVQTALEKNPAIEAAMQRLEGAKSKITQARSGLLPRISFSEHYSRTTNPMFSFGTKLNQEIITLNGFDPARLNNPDPVGDFTSTLSATWSIYDGGRTRSGIRQAELGTQASERMLHRTRQGVMARTAAAYTGVLLAGENIRVVKQALETAKVHRRMVESRFQNGFAVKSDLLQAEVRIGELEQQFLQAESGLWIAESVLNAAMGTPVESVHTLADGFSSEPALAGEIQKWTDQALTNRPELQAIRLQASISREEIEKSRGARLPSVSLMGNYDAHTEDFENLAGSYQMGAMVQIQLYSGNRISAMEQEARASLAEHSAMEKELVSQIQVEVRQAFFQTQTAEKRIQVSRIAAGQAEEALRIVRSRYENGLLPIVDLLSSEVSLQKAQMDYTRSLYEFAVSSIQLQLAAGTLNEDVRLGP